MSSKTLLLPGRDKDVIEVKKLIGIPTSNTWDSQVFEVVNGGTCFVNRDQMTSTK